ncbi:hypothetical protein PSN45_001253 [Yamadazyma tenuis]|nr:hypothetical protein PSN45_001253 [Yamadazyma tenuis]
MAENLPEEVKAWLLKSDIISFINSYFSGFHLHTPFLHQPTFDPLTTPDILLYSLIIVGALYSDDHEDVQFASSLLVTVDDYIQAKSKVSKSPEEEQFDILQAYICTYTAQTWVGTSDQRDNAILKFPKIVKMVRNQNLTNIRHKSFYARTQSDWESWVDTEKRIRVVYSAWLLDTSYLIFFEQAPRLFPAELNIPLPSHHNWWDSPSYESWHSLCSERPLFLDVVHSLMNNEDLHSQVELYMYDFFVLLHGLYVNMWLYKQLLNSFTISQVAQQKMALENWRKTWEASMKNIPANEWSKFGFCRDAMEYYWLARMFLASREDNLALDFQNPGYVSNKIEEISDSKASDEKLLSTLKFMKAIRHSKIIDNSGSVKDLLRQVNTSQQPQFTKTKDIFEFVLWKKRIDC